MIVKKNPIDESVKSLQDQLAAVSFATSAVSDSILASFSTLDLRDLRAERLDFVLVALILGVRRGELAWRLDER